MPVTKPNWHSTHTAPFINDFHKIRKQLTHPLDTMLSYRACGEETNALLQLQHDFLNLMYVLIDHWSANPSADGYLTNSLGESDVDRTMFLFEMAEFSLKPDEFRPPSALADFFGENVEKRRPCNLKGKDHLAHYLENRGVQRQKHVHGFTLEMLSEFDRIKNTKHCQSWKNYLQKIVHQAFFCKREPADDRVIKPPTFMEDKIGRLPADDQELRARIIESYDQAAAGGRATGFSHPMGQEMDKAIRTFVRTANYGWRVMQNRDQQFRSCDTQWTFQGEAMSLIAAIVKLSPATREKSVQLLWDIAPSLALYGYSPDDLSQLVHERPSDKQLFEQLPDIVKMMDLTQQATKGNEGNLARHTLFNLVNCFCKADGEVTPDEEEVLKTFANTLFGRDETATADLTKQTKLNADSLKPSFMHSPKPSFMDSSNPSSEDSPQPPSKEATRPSFMDAPSFMTETGPKPEEEKPKEEPEEPEEPEQVEATPKSEPKQEEPEEEKKTEPKDTPKPEIDETMSTDSSIAELTALVGLERVKQEVKNLVSFTKIQQARGAKGLKVAPAARHMLFYGNPGTGKTTVARLISQIYKDLGVVSKGHLVECDRSGLVGAYAGQTAIKVSDVVATAVGGVLFIDEAYSLSQAANDQYGLEAIDTLVKLMEDNRHDLVVIAAGYPDKMMQFVSSNPGLRSRFNRVFSFDDYTPPQLLEIFFCQARSAGYEVTTDAAESLTALFEKIYKNRDDSFGNGRDVRNVFEAAMELQATRLASLTDTSLEALSQITLDDVSPLMNVESFKTARPRVFGFQTANK